jgi:hypothetical protein
MIIEQYNKWAEKKTDINEHMPTLKKYGDEVNTITEFGTRGGASTWAWLNSSAKSVICYDINPQVNINLKLHFDLAKQEGKNLRLIINSTIDENLVIDETDILFIDSLHTYDQLSKELKLHHHKAKKYLIFHDTAKTSKFGAGLNRAINEFLHFNNTIWREKERFENNNGLLILERI